MVSVTDNAVILILNDIFFSALGFAAGFSFWQFRASRKGKR